MYSMCVKHVNIQHFLKSHHKTPSKNNLNTYVYPTLGGKKKKKKLHCLCQIKTI